MNKYNSIPGGLKSSTLPPVTEVTNNTESRERGGGLFCISVTVMQC